MNKTKCITLGVISVLALSMGAHVGAMEEGSSKLPEEERLRRAYIKGAERGVKELVSALVDEEPLDSVLNEAFLKEKVGKIIGTFNEGVQEGVQEGFQEVLNELGMSEGIEEWQKTKEAEIRAKYQRNSRNSIIKFAIAFIGGLLVGELYNYIQAN